MTELVNYQQQEAHQLTEGAYHLYVMNNILGSDIASSSDRQSRSRQAIHASSIEPTLYANL